MPTSPERRSQERLLLRMPAKILVGASEVPAYTRDLSKSGFFLEFNEPIDFGVAVEVIMLIPGRLAGGFHDTWFHCHAEVKRVEADSAGGHFGMAGQITSLKLLGDLNG